MSTPSILEVMSDPALFKPWFSGSSWDPWRAVLAALFGLRMSERQLQLFRELTGRQEAPANPFDEAWFVVGRRGGKSYIVALIAVFLACFRDWSAHLAPGGVASS